MIGITGGSQPLISFNYGAARPERIHQTVRCVLTLCICFTGFMFVLSRIVPEGFVRIFTSDSADSSLFLGNPHDTLMIVPLAFQYTFVDSLTALGKPKVSLTLSLFRKTLDLSCACLLPFAFGATSSVLCGTDRGWDCCGCVDDDVSDDYEDASDSSVTIRRFIMTYLMKSEIFPSD